MHKLVIATRNKDKLAEIKDILSELPLEIIASSDLLPNFDVEEDKDTLWGNAAKKAIETARATGHLCLADDTGLFINALNGEPGVYAARYAGKGCSYLDNRKKVLSLMINETDRRAEFKTVIAFADLEGLIAYSEGIVRGYITTKERGNNGFGYDPIFEIEGTQKTYAEMTNVEKNTCSHRSKALKAILPFLRNYFNYII